MAFWSDPNTVPKRNNRFLVFLGGLKTPSYTAKSVMKPSWSVNNIEHHYLSHKFNFPGIVTWDPIEMVFVDGGGSLDPSELPNMVGGQQDNNAKNFYDAIVDSGYVLPENESNIKSNVYSKSLAAKTLGQISVIQIGPASTAGGVAELDRFTLVNPYIQKVAFGTLAYDNENITEISVTFQYDYATFGQGATILGSQPLFS